MRLIAQKRLKITDSTSRLSFTTTGGGSWKVWDRFISLEGEQLFHIGNVCGTCQFFFRRVIERFVPSLDIESIRTALEAGILSLDTTASAFSELLPDGNYIAALFEVGPRLVGAGKAQDYFTTDQLQTWRDDEGSEPASGYYRGESRRIRDREKLFEFMIPLYDVAHLNSARVEHYRRAIEQGVRPTAVSIGVLDVKESMTWPEVNGAEVEPEIRAHWCFANYLLDGHHKMAAASDTEHPITLLSFIAIDPSWQMVDDLMKFYSGVQVQREPVRCLNIGGTISSLDKLP
jgi:hypothetical protein